MVAVAVAGTLGVAAVGTLYLPFMADRDQMRGMDESGGMDAKQRRQMEQYLKNEGVGQDKQQQEQAGVKPGSMWSNMRK